MSEDQPKQDAKANEKTGDAEGGADASGSGNILGGVQPDQPGNPNDERRDK